MWRWLRKRTKADTRARIHESPSERPSGSTDAEIASSLGAIVDEMKTKGYKGPFINVCDGILCTMFHGPNVSIDPPWIDTNENPFQMRIVDCKQFCSDSILYAVGDEAQSVARHFDIRNFDTVGVRESLCDSQVESCLLGYPKKACEIPAGPLAVAQSMEDLWIIYLIEGHFYFVRSWTGRLRHRAKVDFRDHAMFVTEVATNPLRAEQSLYADPLCNDNTFGVRQVDFLIKSLLYNLPCPAPLPSNAPAEAGRVALYVLTEYGRIGWYPTFDDTTEYRLCLNGVHGRFKPNPDNPILVNAISEVTDSGNFARRHHLLDELRNRMLLFAVTFPEEELRKGAVDEKSPVELTQHDWDGQPCFFAYTDITYRIEASHGCIGVNGSGVAALVRQYNDNACIVINPAGPATCVLLPSELRSLANEA